MNEQNNNIPEGFKMTELGLLPNDWTIVTVGQVASVDWGNTSLTKSIYKPIGFPVYSATGQDGYSDFYEHESSAVILSAIGARCGKCFFTQGKWTAIKNTIIIKTIDENRLDIRYLYYFVNDERFWDKSGTGQPFIAIGKAKQQRIPLPPLPEQKAIAKVLSIIQKAIETQDKIISAARELKKSLMRYLFTYGPVPVTEAENVSIKETEIGPVPEYWEVVAIGDVVASTRYGMSLRGNQTGKYPILRMNNLMDGHVDNSDLQYVDLETDDFQKFRVNKGNILFNRTNSYELVGKTAIFESEDDYVFASYLIKVVTDHARLHPWYLNYYLNCGFVQDRLRMLATRGVSQSNINATKLRGFIIPLPPLAEQQETVRILLSLDKKIETEENRKATLQTLFKTILHQLITGKTRVKDLEVGA